MDHAFRFTVEKIHKRIALVRAHRFQKSHPLQPFRFRKDAGPLAPVEDGPNDSWQTIGPGTYWAGANTHFTLKSHFTLPGGWNNPSLHLPFGTLGDIFNHPEALIMIDGRVMGSADRYHHMLGLGGIGPGQHQLTLQGWTGLAGWPPSADAPDRLLMQECAVVDRNPDLDQFLTLAICALETAELLPADDPVRNALLDALDRAFLVLDTRHPLARALHTTAPTALATLSADLAQAGPTLDTSLTAIGHAHMDIAYLWPVAETRAKNARTYANVLRLMQENDDYHFTHSQPQLYEHTKQDFPELFAQIKTRVADGRWEPVGGMWVEPDTNMPGAEALVRQILLGRRWFREAFGEVETPILWLPDTFGFSWCLPQLMKLSGLEMLLTNKLNWNQHNQMPSSATWWQGMDGSKVLFQLLTTPRPVQYLPFPTNYKSDLSGAEVLGTVTQNAQPAVTNLPICFGYGDGGGGPTEGLIGRAKAFAAMPGMPRLKMGRAEETLAATKSVADALPTWRDELYMEGHRGVLTSQGWIKRANRQAEAALHRAELLAVMTGATRQTEDMTRAWKLLCLNQFHDTLSGTAITQVFDDARHDFDEIMSICEDAQEAALAQTSGPLGVLNPSPLPRHALARTPAPPDGATTQPVVQGYLVSLPALHGYETAHLSAAPAHPGLGITRTGENVTLENAFLRAEIGPDGTVATACDKATNRPLLTGRGNQLWAFEDRPLSWDAWDIDPFFEDRGEEITDVSGIEITETGPLRVALRLTRKYRASTITQDIRLTDRSPRLEFKTRIDWHERHTLLKVAFPMAVHAPHATYDIQWGQIPRPTTRHTRHDASKFEVCAHKWAALHDGAFAVALLNDCKYGHDTNGSLMRLTLIKSSTMPDPVADQGVHEFTYALFPQAGPGFEAIRAEAEALNHPVVIAPGAGALAPFVQSNTPNAIIETVKTSEDGHGVVVRVYESEGHAASARLTFSKPLSNVSEVNLMEDQLNAVPFSGRSVPITLRPHQILSLMVETK